MENETENLNSSNETENQNSEENQETEDNSDALKEQNKQLFQRAKKAEEELKKLKAQPKAEENTQLEPKKQGFDRADKVFIRQVLGAEAEDESWISEVLQETGKTLDDLETSKFFQAELKERKDARAAANAIPKGTKRAAQGTRDNVEYWLAKGELPPADQVELRRKVVKAKEKTDKDKSKFTDIPVING